ncbi:hypothetical protein [Spirosoma pollinicola]|uniref:hypothetical protein n=1 Tax=Spirosoma pollinicola TaxID=2057025 RepID=UPI0012FD3BA2|nr:hypothetical protein [Spirosoma pollinicola]
MFPFLVMAYFSLLRMNDLPIGALQELDKRSSMLCWRSFLIHHELPRGLCSA